MSVYPSVPAFLEARRGALRDLAVTLDTICEWGAISLSRGEDGLTFVLPPDDVVADIVRTIEKGDVDDGVALLRAYVIPLYLPSAEAWRARSVRGGGVGTRAGFRLPDPETAGRPGKSLKLEGSVSLKPDSRFASKHRIAVWRLAQDKKEEPVAWPAAGEAWSPPKERAPRARKSSRYPAARVDRIGLIRDLGDEWYRSMLDAIKTKHAFPQYAADPYLISCVSLFNFLRDRDPEAYRALLPLASPIPAITFAIAVGLQSEVVSDRTLAAWKRSGRVDPSTARVEYIGHLTQGIMDAGSAGSGRPPLICSLEGQAELAEARIEIGAGAPTGRAKDLGRYLTTTYNSLASSNALAGRAPVFPAATLKHLGPEKHRGHVLALVDTIRFILGARIHDAFSNPMEAPREIRALMRETVPEYLAFNPTEAGEILERSLVGLVPSSPADMKPAFKVLEFFVRTDAFVSFPSAAVITATLADDHPPDSVVEILRLARFPDLDAVSQFSVEWTFARLLSENVKRGLYPERARSKSRPTAGTTGGSHRTHEGSDPAASSGEEQPLAVAAAPSVGATGDAPDSGAAGGAGGTPGPSPVKSRRAKKKGRRHRRSPTPSSSGSSTE